MVVRLTVFFALLARGGGKPRDASRSSVVGQSTLNLTWPQYAERTQTGIETAASKKDLA